MSATSQEAAGGPAAMVPARTPGNGPSWRDTVTWPRVAALVVGVLAVLYGRYGPVLPGLEHSVSAMHAKQSGTPGPAPASLVQAAQTCLGVFVFFVVTLATEALPGLVVGLASPMLLLVLADLPVPATATDEIPVAFNAFTSDTFFLILGAFVLVAVMIGTGLGKRIALAVVGTVRSTSADRILGALMAAEVGLHAILPTVAETALFLPLSRSLTEIADDDEEKPEHFDLANQGMILAITGVIPVLAGMFFLTAGVPNLVLQGTLAGQGVHITWLDWLWWNLPLWLLVPFVWWLTRRSFRMGDVDLPNAATVLPKMRAELGPMHRGEKWALVCIAVAFVLWTTESLTGVSTGMAALVMVGLLFLPGTGLRLGDFVGKVMWGMLFLIGGAISLGNLLFKLGVVTWASDAIVQPIRSLGLHDSILVMLVLLVGLQVVRAGILSGGAMAAVFVPLSVGLAGAFGYATVPFAVILVNCLQVAIFVPISAVAVLIAVQAADISWRKVLTYGGGLSIVANVFIVVVQTGWFHLIGMPVG